MNVALQNTGSLLVLKLCDLVNETVLILYFSTKRKMRVTLIVLVVQYYIMLVSKVKQIIFLCVSV